MTDSSSESPKPAPDPDEEEEPAPDLGVAPPKPVREGAIEGWETVKKREERLASRRPDEMAAQSREEERAAAGGDVSGIARVSARIPSVAPQNRFWVPLLLVLVLAGLLRGVQPGADPPLSLSTSNAEVMDGPWYMAEAVDAVRALPTDVPPQYRRPLLTTTARAFFSALGGASLERAQLFGAAWGLLLVLAGGIAGRAAFGTRAGLLAAFFLGTSFVLTEYARTPLVQGPLAAATALVFLVQVHGIGRASVLPRLGLQLFAAVLALGVAATLKEGALAMLPGIGVGILVAAQDRRRALVAVLVLALLAAGAAMAFREVEEARTSALLAAARSYMGQVPEGQDGAAAYALEVLKRTFNAPVRSGLATRAPAVLALAWAGALLAVLGARTLVERGIDPVFQPAQEAERRKAHAVESALAAWLVTAVLLFAPFRFDQNEGAIPLRHFAGALVPAALLAGRALDRLRGGVLLPARAGSLLITFVWGTLGGYVLVSLGWTAFFETLRRFGMDIPEWVKSAAKFESILGAASVLGLLAALGVVLHARKKLPLSVGPGAFAVLFGAVIVAEAAWLIPALHEPTYTLRDANARVAETLPPGAVLDGPYAHMLTWRLPAERHHVPDLRTGEPLLVGGDPEGRKRFTHFAVEHSPMKGAQLEAIYAKAGYPLTPVLDVDVRGFPIRVYRYAWAKAGEREAPAAPPKGPAPATRPAPSTRPAPKTGTAAPAKRGDF